jgi:DNA modification methylase
MPQPGLKPKDLCLMTARVALAAQADGWWVRSDIIWSKPNPMPESVRDRPIDAYEHILMLTKSARYFWDLEAVKESDSGDRAASGNKQRKYDIGAPGDHLGHSIPWEGTGSRNLLNVWEFATQPYAGEHFATFPEEIPRRCIAAATSEKGACPICRAPWERIVETKAQTADRKGDNYKQNYEPAKTIGWKPTCRCSPTPDTRHLTPCLVLDPFAGSGTVGEVAFKMGRRFVLIDLAYQDLAKERIGGLALQM